MKTHVEEKRCNCPMQPIEVTVRLENLKEVDLFAREIEEEFPELYQRIYDLAER